jgi:hypothetical protein
MKKFYVCILLLCLLICTSCKKRDVDNESKLYTDLSVYDDKIIMYNIPNECLGIYDKKDCSWSKLYNQDNLFQYEFGGNKRYYVSGNSLANKFVLLEVSEDKKTLHKVFSLNNDNDCFFPLANDDNTYYYILYEDEKNSEDVKRSIFTMDKYNKIQKILTSENYITSGIIIDNILYYTVYEASSDDYSVYSFNLGDKKKQEKLIKSNLETRELYNINGELYYSNITSIFNDKQAFEKKDINYVIEHYLVQIYPNKDCDMICSVTDIETREVLGKYKYPINFELQDNIMNIYCKGMINSIEIGD